MNTTAICNLLARPEAEVFEFINTERDGKL